MKHTRPPKNQQIFIRVPVLLKKWISEEAIEDGRSMSAWIVQQLEAIRKRASK